MCEVFDALMNMKVHRKKKIKGNLLTLRRVTYTWSVEEFVFWLLCSKVFWYCFIIGSKAKWKHDMLFIL